MCAREGSNPTAHPWATTHVIQFLPYKRQFSHSAETFSPHNVKSYQYSAKGTPVTHFYAANPSNKNLSALVTQERHAREKHKSSPQRFIVHRRCPPLSFIDAFLQRRVALCSNIDDHIVTLI